MTEKHVKTYPYNLSEDEMIQLDALVKGPGFKILQKIAKGEVEKLQALLRNAEDTKDMFRLQGRLIGTESIVAVPYALVASKMRDAQKS
jgi:hypothetical protein